MDQRGTIAAIATPPGHGGIAIIKVSGEGAWAAFERCFRRRARGDVIPNRMYYGHIIDPSGDVIDEAMGVCMRGPRSYTAEDVCEFHCHGGHVAAQRVLRNVLGADVRMAEPGEFTRRAFINGRIDLSEAEAVMQLIGSGSEAAARAALRQMEGGVSRFVTQIRDGLMDLLTGIEAGNDFPEEIDEDVTRGEVMRGIERIKEALCKAADERAARIVREGLSVVLVGAPNVGKSSLMNALIGQDRAIVTDIAGTTRDVLTERLHLGGFSIEISDTAGQRETLDTVERIGIERARGAEDGADVVLVVLDASREITEDDLRLVRRMDGRGVLVINKVDLEREEAQVPALDGVPIVRVCALTGEGMDGLTRLLADRMGQSHGSEQQMTAERHIGCAREAIKALDRARECLETGHPVDVASIDLMAALTSMTDITGESASEGVIDRIFAQFCVGK